MKLSLKISPCPNDTFIFHALIHSLVDTEDLDFEVEYLDIDTLNSAAVAREAQVVKLSYAVLPLISHEYSILTVGGALGYGNGPILVSRDELTQQMMTDSVIAIPGINTTAARLLSIIYPDVRHREAMLFSDIARAVSRGEVAAGVLIHEGRFTYEREGLRLVADLGLEWQNLTQSPIPLGGIAVDKRLGRDVAARVARVILRSLIYARANPTVSHNFVRSHARELADDVLRKHIEYFVNDFSLDLGVNGRRAVARLLGDDCAIDFVAPELCRQ